MKLIWKITGDYINCTPIDFEFVEYWVEIQRGQIWNNCGFSFKNSLVLELNTLLSEVNQHLNKLKITLVDLPIKGNDQTQLNVLHKNWVIMHQQYPNIPTFFGLAFKEKLDKVNKILHNIEESWTVDLQCNLLPLASPNRIPKVYGKSNIRLPYENLGRSTYNKWFNFDNSVHSNDTNDYNELHNKLSLNVMRPFTANFPNEFINWCNDLKVEPKPNDILLANFENLEQNLETYRALFMKNFAIDNNDVIFTQ